MSEDTKQEGQEEKKEFPPILKFIFIGLICLVVAGIVGWSSIRFGVEPTFELIGGAIAVLFLALVVAQKFQDKVGYAKGVLIFIGICLFANLFYLGTLWTGEKVYNDNSMWSPAIFALLTVCAVVWFAHWFNGSPCKETITILTAFIGLMVYVLIAIGLGGDEGARFAFVFVTAFEVVTIRLAIPSFLRIRYFKGSIRTEFGWYFVTAMHGVIFTALLFEAVALPVTVVAQLPLSNWQIVVTCMSIPVSWYVLYEVWGKKYL